MNNIVKNLVRPCLTLIKSQIAFPLSMRSRGSVYIAMYHRVLPKGTPLYDNEEPGMVVAPEVLDLHFSFYKRYFDVISLNDLVDGRYSSGDKNSLIVTFDDGWSDNYDFAFPVIKRHKLPATLYVVTDMIGTKRMFWPNTVSAVAATRGIEFLYGLFELELPHSIESREFRENCAALIQCLKSFSDREIFERLEPYHDEVQANDNHLMSWNQLTEMLDSGLVDVGSHTRNHYRLKDNLTPELIEDEICNSQKVLEKKLGVTVKHFCYPNGDYSPTAKNLVEQNYLTAVTTQKGINRAEDVSGSKLALNRIGLFDDVSNSKHKLRARLSL